MSKLRDISTPQQFFSQSGIYSPKSLTYPNLDLSASKKAMSSQDQTKSSIEKRKFFEDWIKHEYVMIQCDSRKEGVCLPPDLQGNPAVALKLSYLFQGETTHDEQGIVSFLRFSGEYYRCVVPWQAIWGMNASAGANQIWAEDMPREVIREIARSKLAEIGKRFFRKKEKKKDSKKLTAVKKSEPPKPEKPKSASHLKRIK